jgi:hypothetical protein
MRAGVNSVAHSALHATQVCHAGIRRFSRIVYQNGNLLKIKTFHVKPDYPRCSCECGVYLGRVGTCRSKV